MVKDEVTKIVKFWFIGDPELLTQARFLIAERLPALPTIQLDLLEQHVTSITKKLYYRRALMNAIWL